MKHFIKMAFYLLSIISIFGISSCEKELYEEQLKKDGLLIKQVSFNEINAPYVNEKIKKVVSNIKLQKDDFNKQVLGKIVYDSINNFYFDDEKAIYIEKENSHSYTFEVFRDYNTNKIENLIFNLNKDGDYDVIFAKYDITKQELENLSLNEYLSRDKEFIKVDEQGKIGLTEWICIEKFEYLYASDTTNGIPVIGPTYYWHWVSVGVDCTMIINTDDLGGGSDSGNTSTNPSGNGNNNSGSNNEGGEIITTPIFCLVCPDIPEKDPCESLKTKSKETKFREKFKDLNGNSRFNYNGETAYFETRDANDNPVYTFKSTYTGNHQIKIIPGTISFMHVHNNINEVETEEGIAYNIPVKMLSPADINVFISTCQEAANNAGVPNTNTYGIMISSEGIFAIKMLENDTFNPEIQNINVMNDEYELKSKEIYTDNPSGSVQDKAIRKNKLQKLLLSLMKKYGLENKVGLYEGEVTDPEPGQLNLPVINWTRKTLNNNGELVESPC